VKQQARTIDLLPTILEAMGGKAPPGVQGTSLAPAFRGKEVPTAYAYAETLFPKFNMGWAELQAMRTNRWKYVRAPKPELYDLAQDPAETTNVIAGHAAEAQELEGQIKAVSAGTEKVTSAPMDPATMKQLRSLGYMGGSSPQGAELTGKGIDPKDRLDVLRLLHLGVHSGEPVAQRISLLRKAIAEDPTNPYALQQSWQFVCGSRQAGGGHEAVPGRASQGCQHRLAVLPPGQPVSKAREQRPMRSLRWKSRHD
jgi:hypothetical protein